MSEEIKEKIEETSTDVTEAGSKEPENETAQEVPAQENKETDAKDLDKGPDAEEKPLDKMTVVELREIAKEIPGVTGVHAMKKEEVLAAIKEYRGIVDEKPVRKKVTKVGLSIKELKEKTAQLRQEKESARAAKDMKRVGMLRRRINRLKKKTRKAIQA